MSTSSSAGAPNTLKMAWSCSPPTAPQRRAASGATRLARSPRTNYRQQWLYDVAPSSSSGHRYQSVTTFVVMGSTGSPKRLANPKSHKANRPSSLYKTLLVLMSRWMYQRECMCATAASCDARHFMSAY